MLCFKRFHSKGQSLVEAALFTPLIVFFLLTIVWFARVVLTWQQITGAARYGTDLLAYTNYSKSTIENLITSYLCDTGNVGRTLDKDKLTVTVTPHDCSSLDFSLSFDSLSNFFNPENILGLADSLLFFNSTKSTVDIAYTYKLPSILKIAGQENLTIKAHSEVLSGTGSAGMQKRSK